MRGFGHALQTIQTISTTCLVTPTGIEKKPDFQGTTGYQRGNKPLFFNNPITLEYPPMP